MTFNGLKILFEKKANSSRLKEVPLVNAYQYLFLLRFRLLSPTSGKFPLDSWA
jgi:hypothetical protein